jgi:hypothetical protein
MLARITRIARLRMLVFVGIGGLLALPAGCGGKSPTAPPAPLDLTGTWSGQLEKPGSAAALRVTWVAIHRGDAVAGVATLVDPTSNLEASGIMSGVVTGGDRLVLTFAAAPGRIEKFEHCAFAGRGDASASTHEIAGSIALLSTACAGTGLELTSNRELRLAR